MWMWSLLRQTSSCTLKYSVNYGREDEFQPKININSTFWALAEGISGCSLIGSCLLVLAALLWLLRMGEDDVPDILLQIWESCYFEHLCICWAVHVYICSFEERVSCIETIHQSLQDEDINNLHQFNWWGCCKSSFSNTFTLLTVPGFNGQNLS